MSSWILQTGIMLTTLLQLRLSFLFVTSELVLSSRGRRLLHRNDAEKVPSQILGE